MIVELPYLSAYLFNALESGPMVIRALLEGVTDDVADHRPDHARFTIREAVCHLADWESIYLERMQRTCAEDFPELPGYDEGQIAVERNYAQQDFREAIDRFEKGRAEVVAFLKSRSESDWKRMASRPEIGDIDLETMVQILPIHDTYHARQIIEWKRPFTDRT